MLLCRVCRVELSWPLRPTTFLDLFSLDQTTFLNYSAPQWYIKYKENNNNYFHILLIILLRIRYYTFALLTVVAVVETMVSASGNLGMTSGHWVSVHRVLIVRFYDLLCNRHTTDPLAYWGCVTHQIERICGREWNVRVGASVTPKVCEKKIALVNLHVTAIVL